MPKFAYIELETSGLDYQEDDVIKYCAKIIEDERVVDTFLEYAKPRKQLSPLVEKLTKITNNDLADCQPSNVVKQNFLQLVDDTIVLARNLDFIEKFLGIRFEKGIELCFHNLDDTQR